MTASTTWQWIAASGFLVVASAGSAQSQVVSDSGARTRYFNCGGFSVTAGDIVQVHASLDDFPDGRPVRATLQLFDEAGAIETQKDAILQAGQSTTLVMAAAKAGRTLLRAHVEFKEAALPVSARRTATALVEVLDLTNGTRTVCAPIDNGVRPPPQ